MFDMFTAVLACVVLVQTQQPTEAVLRSKEALFNGYKFDQFDKEEAFLENHRDYYDKPEVVLRLLRIASKPYQPYSNGFLYIERSKSSALFPTLQRACLEPKLGGQMAGAFILGDLYEHHPEKCTGKEFAQSLLALTKCLNSEDLEISKLACMSLLRANSVKAVPFMDTANYKVDHIARHAVYVLQMMPCELSRQKLRRLSKTSRPYVRRLARVALQKQSIESHSHKSRLR